MKKDALLIHIRACISVHFVTLQIHPFIHDVQYYHTNIALANRFNRFIHIFISILLFLLRQAR